MGLAKAELDGEKVIMRLPWSDRKSPDMLTSAIRKCTRARSKRVSVSIAFF